MRKWGTRLKKVEELAQSFQQSPLATCYKPRLWPCQPSSIWKLFPRQSMAINFVQSCKEDVHVFALEKENTTVGQRIYLVTSYSELWHYYKTYQQSLMHCYEVIPEGAVCKLYFDLEFHKPSNKGLDGKARVSFLQQYVCEKLMEIYGIECSEKDVLNLDSSTEEKFSRHLIFILSNAAFKDNIHVGRFVHAILQQILNPCKKGSWSNHVNSVAEDNGTGRTPHSISRETPGEQDPGTKSSQAKKRKQEDRDLSSLLVKNKEGRECLFVDLGVYTKNRNFRLYKSSKAGKNVALTLAEDNTFISKPDRCISPEESIFLASLICNVSFTGQRILSWDISETKETQTKLHGTEPDLTSVSGSLCGYQYSPYQEVDDFVLSVVKKDGIQGGIRRWNYFVSEQLLVYDILKYRWCENIGRFHKSNNIMIVVDLKEEVWYQKCHDPTCKNFRSSSYPLPEEVCVSYIFTRGENEDDQAYLMDNNGNIEVIQTPDQKPHSTAHLEEKASDPWDDGCDDQALIGALEDHERNTEFPEEVPDQLLLQCMAEFESH